MEYELKRWSSAMRETEAAECSLLLLLLPRPLPRPEVNEPLLLWLLLMKNKVHALVVGGVGFVVVSIIVVVGKTKTPRPSFRSAIPFPT